MTRFGIKPKKNQGELTFPFDLSNTPLKSVSNILYNDFSDYFDDIVKNENTNHWENTKYKIVFMHDDDLSLDKFKIRYKTRINNFRRTAERRSNLKFVTVLYDETLDLKIITNILNSLKNYCGNEDFKYVVINIKDAKNPVSETELVPNVVYKEIQSPYSVSLYKNNWMEMSTAKNSDVKDFLKEFFEAVLGV